MLFPGFGNHADAAVYKNHTGVLTLGVDIKLRTILLDSTLSCMYDERMLPVFGHNKISLSHKSHLTRTSTESQRIGNAGISVQMHTCSIRQRGLEFLVMTGGNGAE